VLFISPSTFTQHTATHNKQEVSYIMLISLICNKSSSGNTRNMLQLPNIKT
jgi:hypothetical protein